MFDRTRLRLTLLYVVLFTVVLCAFSIVLFLSLVDVLTPSYDAGPDLTAQQAASAAYQASIDQMGLAIVLADLVVIALVAGAAWFLATWTLRPIREAHARQRRFVADASHEMRTPLAAIRVTTEEALEGHKSADELRSALDGIADSTSRLTRLTNDLLLLARSVETEPGPRAILLDLSVLVAETVNDYSAAHPDLPRVHVTLGEDLAVTADEVEIDRIVTNLVDNAYRHGGGKESPEIVTRRADHEAVVEVKDHGPGIPVEDQIRIFEPFARLHRDSVATPGSGLGLAIARSLAERNRGSLAVTSRPGAGATFRLAIPLSR